MQIKDVEKLTGLTAKSIRYYESKGLITIEREKGNSYRNYSEDDVKQLKKIKLFRYLDFSIEEISQLLDKGEDQIKQALTDKAESYQKQRKICEDKQEVCLALAKEYSENPKKIDEYNEAIDFMESEEMAETMEKLEDYTCPNVWRTIGFTIVFLGPIIWLFVNIANKKWDGLMLNAALALFAAAWITGQWIHYITQYQRDRKRVKRMNREFGWMIPIAIIVCIAGIAAYIGLIIMVEKLMAPENFLFYEHNAVASVVLIWVVLIPVILVCVLLVAKFRRKAMEQMEDMNDILYIWNHLGKLRPAAILLWVIVLYCCITSVTYVRENDIVYHSPIHPMGIVYDYSQIEKINTGFGNKNFAIVEYKKKGNFYYRITVDGKKITFHGPYVNEEIERYEDSYLELEEFDQRLVALGIEKESSSDGYENCELNSRYVKRFVRIIELKK